MKMNGEVIDIVIIHGISPCHRLNIPAGSSAVQSRCFRRSYPRASAGRKKLPDRILTSA